MGRNPSRRPPTLIQEAEELILINNSKLSGSIADIKSTPQTDSTATLLNIEADGANWGAGSTCIKLISDDSSCYLILGFAGALQRFGLNRNGNIYTHGDIIFQDGGSVTTDTDSDLVLKPDGTGITIVGDAGSTSHSLATNDDLFVTGILEVDGVAYFDANVDLGGTDLKNVAGGTSSKDPANDAPAGWMKYISGASTYYVPLYAA